MISLDTETTGIDLRHGAKPFMVTTCNEEGEQRWWEWEVNPMTREPVIPPGDLDAIRDVLNPHNDPYHGEDYGLILQNSKFDVHALRTLIPEVETDWLWEHTYDTLIAGHLLASNQPHDLTTMASLTLHIDIEPYEVALKEACDKARRECRKKAFIEEHGEWAIAKKDRSDMPSAKESTWKFDTWLPRAVVKAFWEKSEAYKRWVGGRNLEPKRRLAIAASSEGWEYRPLHESYEGHHSWWTVLRDYANADSAVTVELYKAQRERIRQRGLWEIYQSRMKVIPVAFRMECHGVTMSKPRLEELTEQYTEESNRAEAICLNIAESLGHDLTLPKGGVNGSLKTFMFDVLKVPKVRNPKARSAEPSLAAGVMKGYLSLLPPGSKGLTFVKTLLGKRSRDVAITYMKGYQRFWHELAGHHGWYVLYPSLNPTGTDTLRWSSSNPNEQNISKKEGFNLRYCFGPAPGWEWWSCDAENIELRIPAYDAGEQAMIDLFERPNDPPYFGSNHLLAAHILHPKEFEACVNEHGIVDGRIFKKKYASTLYQWTKNGNFAVQYGAQEESGTADRAYHVPGGQALIQKRLGKIADLNRRMIAHAERFGFVETMPDKTVNPTRGYPLLCTRTEYGRIKPTVPLSYRVQGTAMWWMQKAMVRCDAQLQEWRDKGFDAHIVMQIHDEIVFSLPKSKVDPRIDPKRSNLPKVRQLQRLMALGGDDIGVPTPVSCEYHPNNWSEGIRL